MWQKCQSRAGFNIKCNVFFPKNVYWSDNCFERNLKINIQDGQIPSTQCPNQLSSEHQLWSKKNMWPLPLWRYCCGGGHLPKASPSPVSILMVIMKADHICLGSIGPNFDRNWTRFIDVFRCVPHVPHG